MIKNEILIQSPTRIDVAGGTLDCWPINALLGNVTTINVAINIYTTCRLSPRDDKKIWIHSRDTDTSFEFENIDQALSTQDPSFQFFKEHIAFWEPKDGFNLSTQSDSPIGGGLGGSSSLTVSIFKTFMELTGTHYTNYEVMRYCSGLEAKILNLPTGTQDYYPALQGGLNIIDYTYGEPRVKKLSTEDIQISDRITLFYTGRSHHSAINNWQVIKSFIDGDRNTVDALEEISVVSELAKMAILDQEWEGLPQLFRREYNARMRLADSFASPEIEKLTEIAMKNGGEAVKICGAGGGGCVFVWSKPSKRESIIDACEEAGFEHLEVEFV